MLKAQPDDRFTARRAIETLSKVPTESSPLSSRVWIDPNAVNEVRYDSLIPWSSQVSQRVTSSRYRTDFEEVEWLVRLRL